jgi:hypothetical protein
MGAVPGTGLILQRYRILGASAVAVSGPADTSENILATINIPAGAMGLNGILRVTTQWTVNNNANVKAARARLGGIGGTDFLGANIASTLSMRAETQIANRGVANSQVGFGVGTTFFGTLNGAAVTGAIDTSAATTLVITAAKATAGDTMTLEQYLVELLRPDLGVL